MIPRTPATAATRRKIRTGSDPPCNPINSISTLIFKDQATTMIILIGQEMVGATMTMKMTISRQREAITILPPLTLIATQAIRLTTFEEKVAMEEASHHMAAAPNNLISTSMISTNTIITDPLTRSHLTRPNQVNTIKASLPSAPQVRWSALMVMFKARAVPKKHQCKRRSSRRP